MPHLVSSQKLVDLLTRRLVDLLACRLVDLLTCWLVDFKKTFEILWL